MDLKRNNIIITTHIYTTGPAQDLRDYLIEHKVADLLYIGHPLFFNKKLDGSGFERYKNGELITKKYQKIKKRPEVFNYFLHVVKSLKWVFDTKSKRDLFVGSDNLNAFSGIVLKKLGRVKKVVYYVIDYNPHRFKNPLMNKIYHKIDQYCVKKCDETWNLSVRMKEGREKYFNFSGGNQITVPIGVWFDRVKPGQNKSKMKKLAFMGHILKKQGVQYIISAIPQILKKVPNFRFEVIGGGEYLPELVKQAKKLKVEKYIKFYGFVESHEKVEKLLSTSDVAVAMYEKYDEDGNLSFTYFADPGKLKSYLAGGLPIILTDVSHNAKEIERLGCGKIITTDKNEIAKAVISILKDKKKLAKMRQNALEYAKKYDWNQIFETNLKRILK